MVSDIIILLAEGSNRTVLIDQGVEHRWPVSKAQKRIPAIAPLKQNGRLQIQNEVCEW
jgi:hypothetical protein